MRTLLASLLPVLVVLAGPVAVRAADPGAPVPSTADADWQKFEGALSGGEDRPRARSVEERNARIFGDIKRYLEAGDAFIRRHPDDARRWRAFLLMTDFFGACLNLLAQNPESTAAVDEVMPGAERASWQERLAELERQFHAAADVPAVDRFHWDVREWYETMSELRSAKLEPDSPRWADWRAHLGRLAAKYPEVPDAAGLVKHYNNTRFPGNEDSPLRRRELAVLAASANAHVAAAAREQLRFLDLAREPLDLAFTAADGRRVDLKEMRGKVVLIDFWATWCLPCIEEIPTVRAAYEKYHDRGFEVIGITLENPGFRPNDADAEKARKLEAARQKMLQFTREHRMPWPQHFDGLWWKNEIARRYAVEAIPAMFLLDQEGRLVTTNARGEALEREVRRLLKL